MNPMHNQLLKYHADKIIYVCTSLSLAGCFMIIVTYVIYREIRSPSRHIIVCISIADFFLSLANLLGDKYDQPKTTAFCVIQSFVGSIAVLSSFLWTMMLSVFLYICLVKEKLKYAVSLIHPWFHLLCWLLPVAINLLALFLGRLGDNDNVAASGWCWIKVPDGKFDYGALAWMLIDGKGLEIITCLVIIILYVQIRLHLRKQIQNMEKGYTFGDTSLSSKTIMTAKSVNMKFILIPVSFILLRIWGTIRFILYAANKAYTDDTFSVVLLILQTLGDNLVGAVNCILFCFLTPKVFDLVKNSIRRLCGKCSATEDESTNNDPETNQRAPLLS